MQKFFTNTIESKFIKSLLKSTPIPNLLIAPKNKRIIEGCRYLYNNSIIECTKSGVLLDGYVQPITVSDDTIASDTTILNCGFVPASYKVLSPFSLGEDRVGITERYVSPFSYYDSDTHYFLGQYLRCLKGVYGIDLMPFYNCFNYRTEEDFYLNRNASHGYKLKGTNGYDSDTFNSYKVIIVPIKFDTDYTVAIDCSSPVLFKSVMYGKLGMLNVSFSNGASGYLTDYLLEADGSNVITKGSTDFKKPFVYSISSQVSSDVSERDFKEYEKYLYLAIQMPIENNSSIVVLEGNYLDAGTDKVFNAGDIDKLHDDELNHVMLSSLSLLQFNDRNNYAFSDRLIEYLLLNVISPIDEIWQNTERVRTYVHKRAAIEGVWDNSLRNALFKKYMSDKKTTKLDINGFVDKNMEKCITRGFNV